MKPGLPLCPLSFSICIALAPLPGHATELEAGDGSANDLFGYSVSISGSMGFIGAYGNNSSSGTAYIFRNLDPYYPGVIDNNGSIDFSGQTGLSGGYSVSLSGNTGLVGVLYEDIGANVDQGAVYAFRNLNTTSSITQVKLVASDGAAGDRFGISVAASGNYGLVGAWANNPGGVTDQGAAYFYRNITTTTGTITQNTKLTASDGAASDLFGRSVGLSGATGLVGSYHDDIGSNTDQGSAYVFRGLDTAGATKTQNAKLIASDGAANDRLGFSVSISGNAGLAGAFGNAGKGAAYLYRNLDTVTGTQSQNAKLTASDGASADNFGYAVSMSGSNGLVGAYGADIGGNANQGAAYLFRNLNTATGTVTQNLKISASYGQAGDEFGASASLDGDSFIIGADYGDGVAANSGNAYYGTVSSMTTLDSGNTGRWISGLSFVTQDDWIIGQTTNSNEVILGSGDSANVTASGKAVFIGKNSNSGNNSLYVSGTLTASQINVGAAGNTGNQLVIGSGATVVTSGSVTNYGTVVFNGGTLRAGGNIGNLVNNLESGSVTINSGVINIDTQAYNVGLGASVGGLGSLVKNGTGTLTLTGSNIYNGTTTVNNGTLVVDNNGTSTFGTLGSGVATVNGQTAGGIAGSMKFINSASAGGGTFIINGGAVSPSNGASIQFYNTSTAGSGNFTNNAGTAGDSGQTWFRDSSSAGNSTITNNGATSATFYPGGVTYFWGTSTAGSSTLIANGGSNGGYSGSISFLENSTGATATVKVYGGGSLGIGSNSAAGVSIGSLEGTGLVSLGAKNLAVGGNNSSTSFSGVASGTGGSLTKTGSGTLALSGLNTYTGATAINQGTLGISSVATGSASQPLGANTGANAVTLGVAGASSGKLSYTGAAGALDKNITALGNGGDTIHNSGSGLLTLSGTLTKNGTVLTLNGGANGIKVTGQIVGSSTNSDLIITGGTTTLTNTNTYNGPTFVYGGGTLINGNAAGALPSNTVLTLGESTGNTTGTFDLGGYNQTIGGLNTAGTGGISNNVTNNGASHATLAVSGGGTFAGTIRDGSKITALTVTGGSLSLTGNNTYTGGTTVKSGTLVVSTGGSINHTSADAIIGETNGDNGALTINGGSVSSNIGYIGRNTGSAGTVTVNSGSWSNSYLSVGYSGTGTMNISGGTVSNAGGTIGDGTATGNGSVTVSGGTWNNSSYLHVGNWTTGQLTISGGTVTGSDAYIGTHADANGTTSVSAGSWDNYFDLSIGVSGTGALNISGGSVTDRVSLLGVNAGSSGTAIISGGSWSSTGAIIIGHEGSGALSIIGGNVTASNAYLGFTSGSNGTALISGGTLTTSGWGTIGRYGSGALNITGSGVVTVNSGIGGFELAANTGSTGTLNIGTGGAAGTLNAAEVNGGSGTATVNFNHTGSVTFAPQLTGSLSVNKTGSGTTTLTGNNTYTGTTTVNQGKLVVNGNISTSVTTVNNGGTLGGSGSVGAVTVMSGGTIAPGNSIESLATGSLTLAGGSNFAQEINNDAAASVAGDLTAISGNLTLSLLNDANLVLTELGTGAWTIGEKLTLISYTGIWNGGLFKLDGDTLADDSTFNFSGMDWKFNYNDLNAGSNYTSDLTGSKFVTMTAIPEPGSILLLGCSSLLLLYRRRDGSP